MLTKYNFSRGAQVAKRQVTHQALLMADNHNSGAVPVDNRPLEPNALAGKTALITGGSRGIGFAAAAQLSELGAKVILVAQDQTRLEQAVSELARTSNLASGYLVDLTNASAIAALAEQLKEQEINILINSAGVMSEKTAKTLRTETIEWHRVMNINLHAPFEMIRHFVPAMVERREGRIINVSACLGRFSGPGNSGGLAPYRISKSGLNALTKNLAAELGSPKRGVLVDAICPGHCQTDMGGPTAPRSAAQGAETITWLAARNLDDETLSGFLWEDRAIVPW